MLQMSSFYLATKQRTKLFIKKEEIPFRGFDCNQSLYFSHLINQIDRLVHVHSFIPEIIFHLAFVPQDLIFFAYFRNFFALKNKTFFFFCISKQAWQPIRRIVWFYTIKVLKIKNKLNRKNGGYRSTKFYIPLQSTIPFYQLQDEGKRMTMW